MRNSIPIRDDFIRDLYHMLDTNPRSVFVHERLIEAWHHFGDQSAAQAVASSLLSIDPHNALALQQLQETRLLKPSTTSRSSVKAKTSTNAALAKHPSSSTALDLSTPQGLITAEKSLTNGYSKLRKDAAALGTEMAAIEALLAAPRSNPEEGNSMVHNLSRISAGHVSALIGPTTPRSVRELARDLSLLSSPDSKQQHLIDDFEQVISWASSDSRGRPASDPDSIRSLLVKRKTLLDALLPDDNNHNHMTAAALSYVENHHLSRRYANDETMLGDPVASIPASHLLVTEDNYAWDMAELAAALLAANSAAMRNPLTKTPFSESDVKRILAHPLGERAGLRPMRDAQEKLVRRGVHADTVGWIQRLGDVMVAEQAVDMGPSRALADEFLAYVAALPAEEQKTLEELKVPGRDSYNGQEFDSSVMKSVRDFKANVTCVHKVGDFLKQAAAYFARR